MNFTYTKPDIKIDKAAIAAAARPAIAARQKGENIVNRNLLTPYKILTCAGTKLPEDKLAEATRAAQKKKMAGLLTEEDRQWCRENGIDV